MKVILLTIIILIVLIVVISSIVISGDKDEGFCMLTKETCDKKYGYKNCKDCPIYKELKE